MTPEEAIEIIGEKIVTGEAIIEFQENFSPEEDETKLLKEPGIGGHQMSDDLISREALLAEIRSSFLIPILKRNLRAEHKAIIRIEEIIKNMPPAFNQEKVIQKLRSEIHLTVYDPMLYGRYIKKERAIEIVEKGGIE